LLVNLFLLLVLAYTYSYSNSYINIVFNLFFIVYTSTLVYNDHNDYKYNYCIFLPSLTLNLIVINTVSVTYK